MFNWKQSFVFYSGYVIIDTDFCKEVRVIGGEDFKKPMNDRLYAKRGVTSCMFLQTELFVKFVNKTAYCIQHRICSWSFGTATQARGRNESFLVCKYLYWITYSFNVLLTQF